MKKLVSIATIGLAVLGLTPSANAFRFSPAKARFSASGPATATLNGGTLVCTGHFRGATTKSGKGRITAVSFTGATGCSTVAAAGLPWTFTATGAETATIANADFIARAGPCGPANMAVTLSGGVISYNSAFDQCSHVGLTLTTKPTLSIVP